MGHEGILVAIFGNNSNQFVANACIQHQNILFLAQKRDDSIRLRYGITFSLSSCIDETIAHIKMEGIDILRHNYPW